MKPQIVLQPERASFYGDLGVRSLAAGDVKGAAVAYLRSLRLDPTQHRMAAALGQIFHDAGHLDVAIGFLRSALAGEPGSSASWGRLAACRLELGWVEEASACIARAAWLDPADPVPAMAEAMTRLYKPGVRLVDIQQAAGRVAERLGPPLRESQPRPYTSRTTLTLGFLSADFRRHPVAHLVLPAFEGLAKRDYRLACYSTHYRADAVTERFKACASLWREAYALSDQALAEQIEKDGVDILIDLAGFTAGQRLAALNRRPAPLQLGWAGFPGTTGLAAIDYLITDRYQVPATAEPFYAEKILRMPHSYVAFGPPADFAPSPMPAARNGFVTFACFNAAKKINERVVALWSRLLQSVPGARLLLKAEAFSLSGSASGRFRDLFAAQGVAADRLTFLGSTSRPDHMAAMAGADIALDPFPYSGGQTTLELLWAGLPVITLPGETWASRHSAGYLTSAGLAEFIAGDEEDYMAKAAGLARDLERLGQLRSTLRERLLGSPLCDVEGFVRDLDVALRALWMDRSGG